MSNENRHFWTLFSTSFKLKNNNHTKATKYKGFSELLFTFQPFPRQPSICLPLQSFRLLSRATALSPNLLPIHSPNLLPAFLVFRFSPFRLLNKYARPARRSHTYPPAYISCPRTHTHIFTKNKPSFRRLSPYSWLSSSFRFIIILRPRVRRYGSNGYSHWQRRVFGALNTDFLLSRSDYSERLFYKNHNLTKVIAFLYNIYCGIPGPLDGSIWAQSHIQSNNMFGIHYGNVLLLLNRSLFGAVILLTFIDILVKLYLRW